METVVVFTDIERQDAIQALYDDPEFNFYVYNISWFGRKCDPSNCTTIALIVGHDTDTEKLKQWQIPIKYVHSTYPSSVVADARQLALTVAG